MRAPVLAALLSLAMLLAGCLGGEDEVPADEQEDTNDPGTGGTGATPGGDGGASGPSNNTTGDVIVEPPSRKEQKVSVAGLYPLPRDVPSVGARFEPAEFSAPTNSILNLTFTNSDRNNAMTHAIKIDGIDGAESGSLGPTQTEKLEFLITLAPGEYEYYCKNHPPGPTGLAPGKLTVTAA